MDVVVVIWVDVDVVGGCEGFFFFPFFFLCCCLWLRWIWLVASGLMGWLWYRWVDVVAGDDGLRRREIEERETARKEE